MKFRLVSLFILAITVSSWSSGASLCPKAHSNVANVESNGTEWNFPEFPKIEPNLLNVEALATQKLALSPDGTNLLDLSRPQSEQSVGTLRLLKTKYLFQWAGPDFQRNVLAHHGISKSEMNIIIEAPAQKAGKGFYVSVDPLDSSSYGSHLTVFEIPQPMVILEFTMQDHHRFDQNTEFIQRIRQAGVQAIRYENYDYSWYAVISEAPLQQPKTLPEDVYSKLSNEIPLRILMTRENKNLIAFLQNFPKQSFVYRYFTGDNLTVLEFQKLKNFYLDLKKGLGEQAYQDRLGRLAFRLYGQLQRTETTQQVSEFLGSLMQFSRWLTYEQASLIEDIRDSYQKSPYAPKVEEEFFTEHPQNSQSSEKQLAYWALKGWIAQSRNDLEFSSRSRAATQLLLQEEGAK